MRTARTSNSILDPDAIRRTMARHITGAGGLLLMGFAAILLVALATWSAADPSYSHATDTAVTNSMGHFGAIISDLLMQFSGFASFALVIPVGVWGWHLFRKGMYDKEKSRLIAWLSGLLAISLFLAPWPTPNIWPLPSSLGGVLGDMLIRIPQAILGASIWSSILIVALSGLAGAFCLYKSCAPVAIEAKKKSRKTAKPKDGRRIVQRNQTEPDWADEDDSETESLLSRLEPLRGALSHTVYTAKAAFRTKLGLAPVLSYVRKQTEVEDDPLLELERRNLQDADIYEDEPSDEWQADFDMDNEPSFDGAFEDHMPIEPAAPVKKAATAAQGTIKPAQHQTSRSFVPGKDTFELPALDMLTEAPARKTSSVDSRTLENNARALEGVLEDFGVKGQIINVRPGPVVTLYELEPAPGIKSSRVIGLADDIARSMSAISARVAVIPGRNAIGIELPNAKRDTVYLRELLASQDFDKTKGKLPLCLGKTIGGEAVITDLARMPHLLVAGTTGSGKSVSVNTMILSLLYRMTPDQCRLIMIDPKMLELSIYDGIPHLLTPVVTDPKKAVVALKWAVREMEDRYRKMSKLGVRNIDGFNTRVAQAKKRGETMTRTVQTGFDKETGEALYEREELDLEPMPFIVILVDEMADLMLVAGKDIEGAIQRLAQMARAAGIHLIMATQRPSVDVITGTIKANFPTRVSFQVTSKIDSRTILGEMGAEQLLGQGDMLYMAGGGRIQRVHGPFVSDEEVEDVVSHLKLQGVPDYLESITDENEDDDSGMYDGVGSGGGGDSGNELYDKAVNIVLKDRKASTSYIQRRLSIGYNRAATLIEQMEQEGVISPANHAGKREILVGEDA
jgi:S-DNA-T family DNA segregation ATPase FtsK/SpoIIIE